MNQEDGRIDKTIIFLFDYVMCVMRVCRWGWLGHEPLPWF